MGKGREPGFLGKINHVIDFWESPCDAPWTVYVELAREPAQRAILQLVVPSFNDVIRAYFRPKGLRGNGHFRRKRQKGGRRGRGIPDTSELIGKNLPGHGKMAGRNLSEGVKNLWMLDGVIQRAFWYWLLAEVASDFFYEWTTAIQESWYCQNQVVGSCTIIGGQSATILHNWVNLGNDEHVTQHGTCYYVGVSTIAGGGGVRTAGIQNIGGTETAYNSWMFNVTDNGFGRGSVIIAIEGCHGFGGATDNQYRYGVIPGGGSREWQSGPLDYTGKPLQDRISGPIPIRW